MPYEDFELSARSMDLRTLTIQRFDAWRVWHALVHGAPEHVLQSRLCKMWTGHLPVLVAYGNAMCREHRLRQGGPTELENRFREAAASVDLENFKYPEWLGLSELHVAHRSNMIRLNPEHYQAQWPGVPEGLPLVWPATTEGSR